MISHFFTAPLSRKEPRFESISRFRSRVFRTPIAAEPLVVSLLPREGEVSCRGPSSRAHIGVYTAQ